MVSSVTVCCYYKIERVLEMRLNQSKQKKRVKVWLVMVMVIVFMGGSYMGAHGLVWHKAFIDTTIKVEIDGESFKPKEDIVVIKERVYLPVRDTAEAVGKQVIWDGETKTVRLMKEK